MGDSSLYDQGYLHYCDKMLFIVIKFVNDKTPLNVININIFNWYQLYDKQNVSKLKEDGSLEKDGDDPSKDKKNTNLKVFGA